MVFVDIYGGEPFLTPALFDALQRVADAGQSHNTSLRLHTNVTIFNQQYLEILSKFKSVSIGLSVDSDQHKELEYIRYPVNASVVFDNLEKFKQISNKYQNRRAWLGAAACMYKHKCPEYLTRIAWGKLDSQTQFKANTIAEKIIKEYERENSRIHKDMGEPMLF
jgi:organic radical activating enzyme